MLSPKPKNHFACLFFFFFLLRKCVNKPDVCRKRDAKSLSCMLSASKWEKIVVCGFLEENDIVLLRVFVG